MGDYIEIDFLPVGTDKSGDAITIRYQVDGYERIHVVDAGFQNTGEDVVSHINSRYNYPSEIDAVVVTHPDADHAGGLQSVLKEYRVQELWMLRPWIYAGYLIDRFSRFTSPENLAKRLRDVYPAIATLEEIAVEKGIPIYEPFQGQTIGHFTVLAPTPARYFDLIVQSEKTPESAKDDGSGSSRLLALMAQLAENAIRIVLSAWGAETFSSEETSAENEMSVVQSSTLFGKRIVLTGDTGRSGLIEAATYASTAGILLPGLDLFQVPHHGSRHNVSTETLDSWLGPRLTTQLESGSEVFWAVVSAAKNDDKHPRKAVVRAMYHRGGGVAQTKGEALRYGHNAPPREGWSTVTPVPYPQDQEET